MTEEKLIELVQKIEKRTKDGVLNWESTAVADEFQSTLASFVIRVRREVSNDGGIDFAISLVDSNGADLESVSDRELKKMMAKRGYGTYGVSEAYDLMESVFKNAKRKALGVDKALDDILSELNDQAPPA